MTSRTDYYTNTVADAGAFEWRFGPEHDDDRPTRAECDADEAQLNGDGPCCFDPLCGCRR